MKRGKRYRGLREGIDRTREYSPGEAISTVKAMQSAKFTEAVEVHIRLGVNVRHADLPVAAGQLEDLIELRHVLHARTRGVCPGR